MQFFFSASFNSRPKLAPSSRPHLKRRLRSIHSTIPYAPRSATRRDALRGASRLGVRCALRAVCYSPRVPKRRIRCWTRMSSGLSDWMIVLGWQGTAGAWSLLLGTAGKKVSSGVGVGVGVGNVDSAGQEGVEPRRGVCTVVEGGRTAGLFSCFDRIYCSSRFCRLHGYSWSTFSLDFNSYIATPQPNSSAYIRT